MQTVALLASPWGVTLHRKTKAGKRSGAGSKFLLLNYCPICGKDLREKSEEDDDATDAPRGFQAARQREYYQSWLQRKRREEYCDGE